TIPKSGRYFLWVRYGDWREKQERFRVSIKQGDKPAWSSVYGEHPTVEEDNEAKLYFGWAFAWDRREGELQAGEATLTLDSAFADRECRQIDVLVLTTDPTYTPLVKNQPANLSWEMLARIKTMPATFKNTLVRSASPAQTPDGFAPRTYRDKGFLYLWNVS